MLKEIITNEYVLMAIATIIGLVIGKLWGFKVNVMQIFKILATIISAIFKAEIEHPQPKQGVIKKMAVVDEIEKQFDNTQRNIVRSIFGSLPKATEFVFKNFVKPVLSKGITKIIK